MKLELMTEYDYRDIILMANVKRVKEEKAKEAAIAAILDKPSK